MPSVSVIVPCHNPEESVFETIASVRAQTCREIELILVDDGTDRPECLQTLERASRLVDRYIGQEARGLPGARNSGFQAAGAELVIPLDAGDLIGPEYARECTRALEAHPSAAFAYTGIEVFGGGTRVDLGTEYNLDLLLESNHLTCTALVRRSDWQLVGGYDESMRGGCEDWDFWLRLGAQRRFGTLVPLPLFRRRSRGPWWDHAARRAPDKIVSQIRRNHPELYDYDARVRIKAEWRPAVCLCGTHESQTIGDVEVATGDTPPRESKAAAFLIAGPRGADSHAAEMAALAVWAGKTSVRLPDGSLALSRKALRSFRPAMGVARQVDAGSAAHQSEHRIRRGWLRQHFVNAELDSWNAWLRHPVRSALRLVPLRVKERINQAVGSPLFDLSFYLQFQPSSILVGESLVQPLRYLPKQATRRRVALITPHLGPGGAEQVLLDLASALDREHFEVIVLATHSRDNRWAARWRTVAEHIYDLAAVIPPQRMSAAIYSIVTNWECGAVLVQNSLFGYAALPPICQGSVGTRTLDLMHAVGGAWDQVSATAAVSEAIDVRIAVSDSVRRRLLQGGASESQVRLIKSGVDLQRFRPRPGPPNSAIRKVLFGGRLDAVKRPLLLIDIAEHLAALRTSRDFRIVIAGDGPELPALRSKARRRRVEDLFEFLGLVDDMAPLYAESDALVLTSREEGVPLVILEAMASARPLVASKVGAIAEVLDPACGFLVETGKGEAWRFATALQQLLKEPQLQEAMGAAGRRKAEAEFDLSAVRAAYRKLLE
jgi:glycosyltransferase involved in cell wall biosynthesis